MICLPQSLAHDDELADIAFHIAAKEDDLYKAFTLVHRAYVRAGLMLPNQYEMRVTPFHLLPTTEVVLASLRQEAICTATVVRDGLLGLPMDSVYGSEVTRLRDEGLRLAEVSCLADRRRQESRGFPVLGRLMSLIAQISRARGVDQLLVAVHPHHEGFYRKYLGFERFAGEASYPSVRNHPAVALALDLNNLAVRAPRSYRRLFGSPFPAAAIAAREMPRLAMIGLRRIVHATNDAHDYVSARMTFDPQALQPT